MGVSPPPAIHLDPADWRARARKRTSCWTTSSTTSSISASGRSGSRFPAGARPLSAAGCRRSRPIWPPCTTNSCDHSALRHRQCASRLHGLGARRRHAGGMLAEMLAAGLTPISAGATTCPSRWSGRSSVGAPALRFPRERKRAVRHRHLDGQSDRRAGGPHRGAWRRRAPLRACREAGRLTAYASAAATAVSSGDGLCRPRHRRLRIVAADREQRIDLAALRRGHRRRPQRGRDAVPGRRQRRHGRYRRHRRSRRRSRASRSDEKLWFHVDGAFGALGRAGAGAGAAACRHRASGFHRASIFTNGPRCPMTPASSWCATAMHRAPSPRPPPICAGRRAGWPPARHGRAISGRTCRAASARSRPGSRSRSTAHDASAPRSRTLARWRDI